MTSHNPKPTARNSRFYLARMQACQTEAQEASLPNLRDRALRAAVAWREMYQKALQFEQRLGQYPLRGHYVPDGARLAVRGDRQSAIRTVVTSLRETIMTIFLIILVSVLLLALFVGVTVAGGRSHDRQNKRRDNDR